MPTSTPRLCSRPGCNQLGPHSHRANIDQVRPSAALRGYDRYHQRWRNEILKRDPLCVQCRAEGLIAPATDADHIIPLSRGGARFALANGQGLCHACHARKTATE